MIDKIKLVYMRSNFTTLNAEIKYTETKSLYNFKWNNYMSLEFNPNRIYNELYLAKSGNFSTLGYNDFLNIWNLVKKDLKNKLKIKYRLADMNRDSIDYQIDLLDKAKISKLHICSNICCENKAKGYVNAVFNNLRVQLYTAILIPQKYTVRYESKAHKNCIVIYDKGEQQKAKYKSSEPCDPNTLRIEIQNRTAKNVKSNWKVDLFSEILTEDGFYSLMQRYRKIVRKYLFENNFEKKESIRITSDKLDERLAQHPLIEFIDEKKFFSQFPNETSFRKYLIQNYSLPNSTAKRRAECYKYVKTYFNSRKVSAIKMYEELKSHFRD